MQLGSVAPCTISICALHFAQAYDDIEHFETAYVVKLFKFHPLAPTQVGEGGGQLVMAVASVWRCWTGHVRLHQVAQK